MAKYFDAHVTAVCNTKNVELMRSLGADAVIDYLQEDFTEKSETYDIIFDTVGMLAFRRCRGPLKPGGMYAVTDSGSVGVIPHIGGSPCLEYCWPHLPHLPGG